MLGWLRSETLESNLRLITEDAWVTAVTPDEEKAAALRIASPISLYFADPAAKRRIAEETSFRGRSEVNRWLREEVFPDAVLRVLKSTDHQRELRLGRRWLNGQRKRLAPGEIWDVEDGGFAQWLKQEIKNAAEALILDRPYPQITSAADDPHVHTELSRRLRALPKETRSKLSQRERELLDHAARAPRNQLPASLGVKPATVRTMIHHIKAKLRSA